MRSYLNDVAEVQELNDIICEQPWYDMARIVIVDDDLCISVQDVDTCIEVEEFMATVESETLPNVDVIYEDDYFYCDHCKQNHYVTNGMKNNRVIISEYDDVACRFCLSWAEKEDYDLAEEYMEHLINNPEAANEFLTDGFLQDHGFTKVDEEYSCGLYEHNRNDNPREIFEEYERNGYDVIFNIKNSNPYETEFSVYVKEVE